MSDPTPLARLHELETQLERYKHLAESVRIEDERLQRIADELGLKKPVDRQGCEGRHTAFTIITALREAASTPPASSELEQIRKLCLSAGMQEQSTTLDYLRGVFYMLKQYVEGKR